MNAVIHCAAHVEEWGPWADYWPRQRRGDEKQLLAAAKTAGIKRFVHIGTEAALFHGQHMRNVDETYPLSLNLAVSLFAHQGVRRTGGGAPRTIRSRVSQPLSCARASSGDRAIKRFLPAVKAMV